MVTMDIWTMTAQGDSRSRLDTGELRTALRLLIDPDRCHEIRFLPSGRSRLARGNALDQAVRAIEDGSDNRGIYLTINPVDPAIGDKAARHRDIQERRYLFLDLDPVRPKDTCATDDEHEAARVTAHAIRDELHELGWPSPIVIDSGNGMYLLYRVDLPNTSLARQILKGCLVTLARRHDTEAVKIDPKVHDPSRIARLPGTWNRKGVSTQERPHRLCRLASVPSAVTAVPIELLKALAGLGEGEEPTGKINDPVPNFDPWTMTAGDSGSQAYARSAMEREVGKVAVAGEGRNNQLHESAIKLGGYVAGGLLSESEVREKLSAAGRACGLGQDGDPNEIDRAIDNGLKIGMETPKRGPEPERTKEQAKTNPTASMGADGKRVYPFPLVIKGSSVDPKDVEWLWENRIPFGFLALLAGRTGVGKSFVTLDIAARLTAGMNLPGVPGGECLDPGNALIISEDSPEYVLAPRLIELGADMDRIGFMGWEAMASFTLSNLEMLEDAYDEAGNPRLVIIDPPTNFLGAKDENKNAELRGVLMGVAIWAMKHKVACVLITHTNKGIKKDMAALDRVIGSVAWASTSRVTHILSTDPDEPSQSLFISLKNNLGELAKGLAYRVRKTDALAVVDWLGEVDITGDQALQGTAKPRRIVASEWLIERFREKYEWPSDELFRAGAEAGVSRNAIFEAKQVLNLPPARRHAAENGDICWFWRVPPDWPPLQRNKNG